MVIVGVAWIWWGFEDSLKSLGSNTLLCQDINFGSSAEMHEGFELMLSKST
jgi:hypothetical protein